MRFRKKTSMRWIALAAMATAALPHGASAQDTGSAQEAQASAVRSFDIPPQSLSGALTQFGQQSGWQVSVSATLLQGKSSPGATGSMTPEQAINRLFSGTGLVPAISGTTVTVATGPGGAVQLDPVNVQGTAVPPQAMIGNLPPPYAGGQVATGGRVGLLGNRSVMDTPFSQTAFTAQKTQDQQAKTVRDVLIDDPSVRFSLPEASIASENVNIRGFVVGNNATSYGGLYGVLPSYSIMSELAERIELLKGLSALLNGIQPFGAIGGTINVVPKRAADTPLTQLTAGYVSSSQFGGHVDVGRRFGPNNEFGVRLNGVYRSGQTGIQWNGEQRGLVSLGLDYRGERARVAADLGYQYQKLNGVIPYLGVANNVPLPYAPNVRNNPGGQPWSFAERKDIFGALRAEFDVTEWLTAYASIGAHDNRYSDLLGGTFLTATNFNGNATSTPTTTRSYNQMLTAEAGLRGSLNTGPVGHEFALSATMFRQDNGSAQTNGTAFATNFYNPVTITQPILATPTANRTSTQVMSSWAVADTLLVYDKRIQLTVGGRLQQVGGANYAAATGFTTSSFDETALSPAVALVVKPWQNVSVYGNFIQGLQPGLVVPNNFANAGSVIPPFQSTQYEAGVKVDWGRFTTTAGFFQITLPSAIVDTLTNTVVVAGEQRNRGFEFNVFGEPSEGVRLLGGLMLLDPVLTKTQGGTTDGWTAPFAPNFNFNIASEWDPPFVRGLTLNGRVVYTGSQYIDTTYPRRSLPAWTRLDVGARFTFDNPAGPAGKPVTLRFNVENLLDSNYWMGGQASTFLALGMPRTFRLSLTATF